MAIDEEKNVTPQDSVGTFRDSRAQRLKDYVWTDVDPDSSSLPLACYCFMTGFMCVVLYRVASSGRSSVGGLK
jgi:hypothetical protein